MDMTAVVQQLLSGVTFLPVIGGIVAVYVVAIGVYVARRSTRAISGAVRDCGWSNRAGSVRVLAGGVVMRRRAYIDADGIESSYWLRVKERKGPGVGALFTDMSPRGK